MCRVCYVTAHASVVSRHRTAGQDQPMQYKLSPRSSTMVRRDTSHQGHLLLHDFSSDSRAMVACLGGDILALEGEVISTSTKNSC